MLQSREYKKYSTLNSTWLRTYVEEEVGRVILPIEIKSSQIRALIHNVYPILDKHPLSLQIILHSLLLKSYMALGHEDYTLVDSESSLSPVYQSYRTGKVVPTNYDLRASSYLKKLAIPRFSFQERVGRMNQIIQKFPQAFIRDTKFFRNSELSINLMPRTFRVFVELNSKDPEWFEVLFEAFGPKNKNGLEKDLLRNVEEQAELVKERELVPV